MNKITLQSKSDPSITITGELASEDQWRYLVSLAPEVFANSFFKDEWERVHDLPTVPGTVIRATIRGVPNVLAFRSSTKHVAGMRHWRSVEAIEEWYLHRDEDIDASTVVVEFVPRDEEGNACPCS